MPVSWLAIYLSWSLMIRAAESKQRGETVEQKWMEDHSAVYHTAIYYFFSFQARLALKFVK